MHVNRMLSVAVACLFCLLPGCTNGGFLNFGKADFPKASPKNPVVQVVSFWQEGTGPGIDKKSCRGFTGQVWFVTAQSNTPAMVDGTVDIFVFDNQGTDEQNAKPIHVFNYPAETWAIYANKTANGLVYSVFVPYTRRGLHEAQCSLIVRFTPREGAILKSEMETVMLSGKKKEGAAGEIFSDVEYEDQVIGERVDAAMKQVFAERRPGNVARSASPIQQVSGVTPTEAAAETLGSIRPSRRIAAQQLTPEYEAQLIREARARMEGRPVVEEADDQRIAPQVSRRPLRNALLADEDELDDVLAERGARRQRPTRSNPLAEEASDDGADETYAPPPRQVRGGKTPARAGIAKKRLLDDDDE